MKKSITSYCISNGRVAQTIWGPLPASSKVLLRNLTKEYAISVAAGDVAYLEGRWYITHCGLLRIAERRRCAGINTTLERHLSDPDSNRWIFKATVFKTPSSKGFVGYGDADPTNVSPRVHGAEMRLAETRAVNRALRKAYGIGICSVEELGSLPAVRRPAEEPNPVANPHPTNGSNNGQPRLRDQLCLLIRQYNLNPTLVKAYAADFCGTEKLGEASRERVEALIRQLAKSAKENRDALQCRLSAYARPQEVTT